MTINLTKAETEQRDLETAALETYIQNCCLLSASDPRAFRRNVSVMYHQLQQTLNMVGVKIDHK